MSSAASNFRKSSAPGTTPMTPLAQMQQHFTPGTTDQILGWTNAANGVIDSSPRSLQTLAAMQPHAPFASGQGVAPTSTSTALARRGINNALVPSARAPAFDAPSELWNPFGDSGALVQQSPTGPVADENDTIEHLEELAQRAKREAQAKRKQIPPFVQKLSSFLDESRNTDLIRWSEKGDSFIVLDEDEFAKTLIPELFKHNNYASFVRQLNMYGFHKRVGLSDNSMKASERKNKSPSEYYNPYFRRGHPNLLWLINKPKGGGNKKKGKKDEGGDGESEDDAVQEDNFSNAAYINPPPVAGRPATNELGVLQKKELAQVRGEIDRLQQQQVAISDMLSKLRREHLAIANQASMFQAQHNRHEQSINAILTFLANVFRKSLEEQGGAQSVHDLLGNLMPTGQVHSPNQMQPGNIVDLGEYVAAAAHQTSNSGVSPMNSLKRAQRLLPPAPRTGARAGTVSPAPQSPSPQSGYHVPQMGSVTELFDTSPSETTSPAAYIKSELQSKPSESMMRIIQDTNAGKSPLNLGRVAAPQSPMGVGAVSQLHGTPMASSAPSPAPVSSPMSVPATAPLMSHPVPSPQVAPQQIPPPPLNHQVHSPSTSGIPDVSLSPILSTVPPPSLRDIHATQAELDALHRMQEIQRQKIDELGHMLGPLSPSGRIPGIEGEAATNGGYFDFDQYFDTNAFSDLNYDAAFTNGSTSTNTDGNDFNFSLDGTHEFPAGSELGSGAFQPGRVLEAQSGGNSPSTASTEIVPRPELEVDPRDAKRRRLE